jgi:hypothetical protein
VSIHMERAMSGQQIRQLRFLVLFLDVRGNLSHPSTDFLTLYLAASAMPSNDRLT